MMKSNDNIDNNMKKAFIENVLIWVVMFTIFVTLFFFVIKFSTIIRIKDNMDALADYVANRVAIEGQYDDTNGSFTDIVATLNNLKVNKISDFTVASLVCNEDTVDPDDYKVTVDVTTGSNVTIGFFTDTLSTKRVVYNLNSSNDVNCTLTVNLN